MRRCASTSATCISTASESSGLVALSCLSSTISRGSARGGRGGRSCTDGNCTIAGRSMPSSRPSPHNRSVVLVGSEAHPFAKTGGLADVLGALPPALGRLGWDATVVLPRYRGVTAGDQIDSFTLTVGGRRQDIRLFEAPL